MTRASWYEAPPSRIASHNPIFASFLAHKQCIERLYNAMDDLDRCCGAASGLQRICVDNTRHYACELAIEFAKEELENSMNKNRPPDAHALQTRNLEEAIEQRNEQLAQKDKKILELEKQLTKREKHNRKLNDKNREMLEHIEGTDKHYQEIHVDLEAVKSTNQKLHAANADQRAKLDLAWNTLQE
jgi:predicted RNase H-like nuclease (RuvC/YqgF family)